MKLSSKLFLLVVLLHVLPIWLFGYFATQDGPSHLHNSRVMLDYLGRGSPIFQQYYEVRPNLGGNVLSQIALIALNSVTPAWFADKVFLTIYVILMSCGFWYAVGAVRPEARVLSFLVFPFVYSAWIHLGLYNFCTGIAVFLFVIGYFIRHQVERGIRHIATLTLLFLLIYATHITAFCAAALVVAALTIVATFQDWWIRGESDSRFLLKSVKLHLMPLIAILPGAFLALSFVGHNSGARLNFDGIWMSAWRIYSVAPIASVSDGEFLFGKAVAFLVACVGICAVYSKRRDLRPRLQDGLLLATCVFLLLSFLGPDTIGTDGVYIRMRVVTYFYLVLILWIAAQQIPAYIQKMVASAAVIISILLFISRVSAYAELDRQIREYMSAGPYIQPGSTLLPLSYASYGYHPTGQRLVKAYLPFEHIGGLLAADKPVVDLSNYEADTYSFWTSYRPPVNPFHFIDKEKRSDRRASEADLLGFPPDSGGRVDYVLIWGLDSNEWRSAPPSRLRQQLQEAYDLIYVSHDRQLVQLYRLKS